jgi:BASS family bile acid:Na+ symporter
MEFTAYTSIDILISVVLSLIMFGIGLSLTFSNFKQIFVSPKSLIIGLLAQMVILPVIAFCVVYYADIPSSLKVGFIILAACPGGTTSGFITYFFKGNVALSISLVAINSLITLVSIPFIVNIGLHIFLGETTSFHLPYFETIIQIFMVAIAPALMGVMVRKRYEAFANKIRKPLKGILIVLLAFVFTVKFFASESEGGTGISKSEIIQIIPYALIINIVAFFAGYLFSRLFKIDIKTAFTVGIEVTMQNTTLAFLVAGTLLQHQNMVKPSLVYSMFSFFTAIVFTYFIKRTNKVRLFDEFDPK